MYILKLSPILATFSSKKPHTLKNTRESSTKFIGFNFHAFSKIDLVTSCDGALVAFQPLRPLGLDAMEQ